MKLKLDDMLECFPEEPHESHDLRSSDASSFDVICKTCGHTDRLGSWGYLRQPCLGGQNEI